jgi:thiol-disulfide isomerase/thioredoxin
VRIPPALVCVAAIALPAASAAQEPLVHFTSDPRAAPAWDNGSWLNSDPRLRLEQLRGRVVLLNFWVFTCGNCTRSVPSLVQLDNRYRSQGLTLVGIHTPEFPPYAGEHDKANVASALVRYGIGYPNAQDNDRRTWIATTFATGPASYWSTSGAGSATKVPASFTSVTAPIRCGSGVFKRYSPSRAATMPSEYG